MPLDATTSTQASTDTYIIGDVNILVLGVPRVKEQVDGEGVRVLVRLVGVLVPALLVLGYHQEGNLHRGKRKRGPGAACHKKVRNSLHVFCNQEAHVFSTIKAPRISAVNQCM